MSGANPNIILGFRPTPNVGTVFDPSVQVTNAQQLLQFKQQKDAVDRQNALMGIFQDPKSLDPTGNPTPETMQKVMAVDPNAGLKLRENMMIGQERQLRTQAMSSDLMAKKMDMIGEATAPILETYETEVKSGIPEEQARRNAQAALMQANQRLQTSGIFTEDDARRFPTTFDPIQMRNVVAGTKQYQDWQKERRLTEAETQKEKHLQEVEYNKGTSLVADNEGNPVVYRPNAPANEQFKYQDGSSVPPDKLKGATKVGTGGSAKTQENQRLANVARFEYERELGRPVDPNNPEEVAEVMRRQQAAIDKHVAEQAGNVAGARQAATAAPKDVLVDGKPQQAIWKNRKYYQPDGVTQITGDVRSNAKPATPAAAAERDAMIVADSRIQAAEQQAGAPLSEEAKAEIRRTARSDPKVQESIRKSEGTAIDDDAAKLIAEETLRGDFHGTVGMGRNQASMRKIANYRGQLAKQQGLTGADLAANTAEFIGITAAERVLGTRGAGIDLGISEAQKFAPMVLAASDKIDRTKFPSVNAMQLAIQKGTGGEDVIRLIDAMNAYKMAYTQILTRGGMPTDDARRRSDEIIDKAWSNGQIRTAIDQLSKEMQAAQSAVPAVRDNLYKALTGKARNAEPSSVAPASGQPVVKIPAPLMDADKAGQLAHNADGTVFYNTKTKKYYDQSGNETAAPGQQPAKPAETRPPAAPTEQVAKPTTQAEFDKLPSGSLYINPADGKTYKKK